MSNFLCEFTEKTVKKYIGSNQWQDCTLSDNYMYLEYHDEAVMAQYIKYWTKPPENT